ncbi:MAG: hypothetical protein QOH90_1312, partial [Actinomycetota bacterium]|nr:hypothetical protein [Actinomycetota bacterium]
MDPREVLEKSDDFAAAGQHALEELAASMHRSEAAPGTVIFHEGARSDCAYLLESGRVVLSTSRSGGEEGGFVAELHPGSLVGDMTALTGRARTAQALATTDVVLWRIPVEALRSAVLADPQLAVQMMTLAMDLVLQKDLTVVLGKKQTTELRRSIDLERETTRILKERDQLKSERVAMMAHDIRSPVSVVIGCAELLSNRWEQMEERQRQKFLDTIARQARSLLDLVDDALQVASIEAGELKYSPAPLDMVELVQGMVEDLCKADESLNLSLRATESLPRCNGDEQRFRQVLFNLLSNAMKFSSPGDPIVVEVRRGGDEIVVSVTDKGIGIPEEEQRRVFEKFARVDPSEGPQAEGTGLGLYICKMMVEAQGGRLWLESAVGQGSTFSFSIPLAG